MHHNTAWYATVPATATATSLSSNTPLQRRRNKLRSACPDAGNMSLRRLPYLPANHQHEFKDFFFFLGRHMHGVLTRADACQHVQVPAPDMAQWFVFDVAPSGQVSAVRHAKWDADEAVTLKKTMAAMLSGVLRPELAQVGRHRALLHDLDTVPY